MKTHFSTIKIVIFLVLISAVAFAQSPQIAWDYNVRADKYDYLTTVIKTSDGGYLMAGYSNSSGTLDKTQDAYGTGDEPSDDYWIVKTDQNGAKEWDKTFGGDNADHCTAVIQTSDGGYLLAGYSSSGNTGDKSEASAGGKDFWIVKTNSDGTKEWDKTIGGTGDEECNAVIEVSPDNYLLAGTTTTATNGGKDYWLVKINYYNGTIATDWEKTFGGTLDDVCTSLVAMSDGYAMAGSSASDSYSGVKTNDCRGYWDYWLIKTNINGDRVWDKTFGGTSYDFCTSLILTSDGGLLLAGRSQSIIGYEKTAGNKGVSDYWIVKLDSDGTQEWDKTFGGMHWNDEQSLAHNNCYSAIQTSDGGYLLGGRSDAIISGDKTEGQICDVDKGCSTDDYWIVKTDKDGNLLWDKTIGGNSGDGCEVILESGNGEYLAGGYSWSAGTGDNTGDYGDMWGYRDYWIVKLHEGNILKITNISGPVDPVAVGTEVSLEVEYEGNATTYSAIWGDSNNDDDVPISESPAIITHTYTSPGVYTVDVTLSDESGNTAIGSYQYVVVYDPSAGFVTGGGWIDSPEGAYTAEPTLTGKASFGFVSKYKKGQSTPDGNTEFQFKAGSLNFRSTLYDWLVIAGTKAMFKGEGTINGEGGYGFMLSAIDDEVDKFRIKIWDKNEEDAVVYDNNITAEENADPATELGGGSIVIHSVKNKSAEITESLTESSDLRVFPNPFTDKVSFQFVPPETTTACIEVYELSGRKAQTVFAGLVKKGVHYNVVFMPDSQNDGIYLYRMNMGELVVTGKLLYKKN